MPEIDFSSPSSVIAHRAVLEAEYSGFISQELEKYMSDLQVAAIAGTISYVVANSLWNSLLERLNSGGLSPLALDHLRSSEIPYVASQAALSAEVQALSEGLTEEQRRVLISQHLGLTGEKTSTFHTGRIVSPDGQLSWASEGETIARTAATHDFSLETLQVARAEGYTHKRWTTRFDDKVRPAHVHADRQTVPLDGTFEVGISNLRFPADPYGAAEDTINCRCALILVKGFEDSQIEPNWNWPT